jgi:YHS domain-containing protein
MNKIIVGIATVLVFSISASLAQESNTPSSPQMSVAQPIEVGNKHCPVTGREIGQMGPAFKYEYNGKIYNLCCGGCPRTFNSDPDKYAKIAEDEASSQNK